MTDYEDFTGRTDAVSTVDIRARVSGYLIKVNFKDGDIVKERRAALRDRSAPVPGRSGSGQGPGGATGGREEAARHPGRSLPKLAEKGAGSQQDLDQYLAKQAENVGALKAAEAQVAMAELNLEFTRITAPHHRANQPHAADAGQPGQRRHHAADHDHVDRSDVRLLQRRGADAAAGAER